MNATTTPLSIILPHGEDSGVPGFSGRGFGLWVVDCGGEGVTRAIHKP